MHSDSIYLYTDADETPFDFFHVPPGPEMVDFNKHDWESPWDAIRPPLTDQQFQDVITYFSSLGIDVEAARAGAEQVAEVVKHHRYLKNTLKNSKPNLRKIRKEIETAQVKFLEMLNTLNFSRDAISYLSAVSQNHSDLYNFHKNRKGATVRISRLLAITRATLNILPEQKNESGRGRPAGEPMDRWSFDYLTRLVEVFKYVTGRLPARNHDGKHPEFDKLVELVGGKPKPGIIRQAIAWVGESN
jgi:hypothetical protein